MLSLNKSFQKYCTLCHPSYMKHGLFRFGFKNDVQIDRESHLENFWILNIAWTDLFNETKGWMVLSQINGTIHIKNKYWGH
jgi:hypothetical protein